MEIKAHEFEALPFNSQICNECKFGPNHPIHSLARVIGTKNRPWVDVGLLPDIKPTTTTYETKDSGKRESYDSGMQRDVQDDKPRYDLLIHSDVGYADQFLTRMAALAARGSIKYGDRNAEKASGQAELDRFRSSAFRHFMQWICGETDEDHAAATAWNLMMWENTQAKMRGNVKSS